MEVEHGWAGFQLCCLLIHRLWSLHFLKRRFLQPYLACVHRLSLFNNIVFIYLSKKKKKKFSLCGDEAPSLALTWCSEFVKSEVRYFFNKFY